MSKDAISGVEHDAHMRIAEARLGSVLRDKWELEELLGIGAMGSVYRGVHRNGSRVAIKVLHPEFVHQRDVLRRFSREGHLANQVDHPGVVRIHDEDVGPDGAPFLVMELLDGESLSDVLAREGPFDPRRAALIGVQILDALAAAHAKGIVHRDVKPANVFLTQDGTARVLDFGIARLFEKAEVSPLTREGAIMGTPAFMPPEQALASWDQIDARTDVWAVGATLYALLTGRTVRDEAAHANEALLFAMWKPVVPIGALRPELPPSLAAAVDRALALDKKERWPSALAMKQALEGAMRTDPGRRSAPCEANGRSMALPLFTAPRPRLVADTVKGLSVTVPLPVLSAAPAPTARDPAMLALAPPRGSAAPHSRAGLAPRSSPPSRWSLVSGTAIVLAVCGVTCGLVLLSREDESRTEGPRRGDSVPVANDVPEESSPAPEGHGAASNPALSPAYLAPVAAPEEQEGSSARASTSRRGGRGVGAEPALGAGREDRALLDRGRF